VIALSHVYNLYLFITGLMEMIHKAAFRDTIGHSLYMTEDRVGSFTPEHVSNLVFRHIESHNGAWGNILAGPPNIFMGPLWGENFKFFFQNGIFWPTLYFWPTAGPAQTSWGLW